MLRLNENAGLKQWEVQERSSQEPREQGAHTLVVGSVLCASPRGGDWTSPGACRRDEEPAEVLDQDVRRVPSSQVQQAPTVRVFQIRTWECRSIFKSTFEFQSFSNYVMLLLVLYQSCLVINWIGSLTITVKNYKSLWIKYDFIIIIYNCYLRYIKN